MSDENDLANRLSRISTLWTVVFDAHRGEGAAVTAAQQRLLQRYGGAVYRYLLGALRDTHAADELAQEFALAFVRGNFRGVDPARGRFRDYVKTVLFHLISKYRQRHFKEPGHLQSAALDPTDSAESPDEIADQEFLHRWREELLGRTWEALAALERETGQLYHTVLHFKATHPDLPSAQVAEQLAARLDRPFTAAGVRQTVHRAREKFADLLLAEVARSLETEALDRVEQELIDLELLTYCKDALARRRGELG